MKKFAGLTLFVVAVVASGLAFSQDPPAPESSDKKIERMEKDLVATRAQVETLSMTVQRQQEALDATIKYLLAQAEGSKQVAQALDASETAGFVYGINPRSREILLAAWREQLTKMQAGLPEVRPEPTPPTPPEPEKGRRPLPPRRGS
jgi:septal ring factor EnvC (AmiA/AmiB activator)